MLSSDVSHFRKIPWCAALLEDEQFLLGTTSSRESKESKEDSLIAETLQTDRTVRAWLTQYRIPLQNTTPAIHEVRAFLDLGDGLNGYPATCHGGIIATLLDEIMGVLLTINVDYTNRNFQTNRGLYSMTAYLKVSYKKPLPLPSIVLGTAKFTKVEGRKQYILGTLEDGKGKTYAVGEALFVQVKPNL